MYRDIPHAHRAPSPHYLRAALGGADPAAGLSVTPDIPQKKLDGVLTWAQPAHGEVPLLLVDTTVMLSGKAGMMVTDRAVYFDNPRLRVPIEAITHAPVRSEAYGHASTLHTALGPVQLPDVHEPCAVAIQRALRAVAFFHRGASRFTYGEAPVSGPVGALAARTLRHPDLAVPPMVPPAAMHAAASLAPTWLDADTGEELLCFLDESVSRDGTSAIALTDRRVIAFGHTPIDAPYAALADVTFKKGMLTSTFLLTTQGATWKAETVAPEAVARPVADFLLGLGAIPPAERHGWSSVAPTATDPSGASAAMAALPWPDLRVATLLELVHAAVGRGAMPAAVGADLVSRALRLQRTLRGGHGRAGTVMRSALSGADLEATMVAILGAPIARHFDGQSLALEYDLRGAGSASAAIASTVIGLTLLAVVGFGWISAGGGSRVQRVRARLWEAPGGSGLMLMDPKGAPLAKEAPALAGGLLRALAEATAPVLLRRAVLGWELPSEALMAVPVAAIEQRARAMVPYADVSPFFAA